MRSQTIDTGGQGKTVKKIVVIDDDREFLGELKEMLVSTGYEVLAFSDGKGAVEEIKKAMPDMVFLDLKMEGKDGFQIANELSFMPETAAIPVIAMTGYYTRDEHRFFMRTSGIRDVILKPVNPLDIIQKIEWLEAAG